MNGKVLVHLKHVKKKKEKNGMLVVHLMQVVPMSWSNGGKKADISPHLSLVTVLLSLCLDTDNSFPHLRNTAGRIWQMYFLNLRNTVYGSRELWLFPMSRSNGEKKATHFSPDLSLVTTTVPLSLWTQRSLCFVWLRKSWSEKSSPLLYFDFFFFRFVQDMYVLETQ